MKPKTFARAHDIALLHREAVGKRPLFAKTEPNVASLYIYELIGQDPWSGEGVTAKRIADALAPLKGNEQLDIYINSEGGDVFEAKAIVAQLLRHKGERVVHVDGIAASAATVIAMAGTKVLSAPGSTWMIHEAWTFCAGAADDLRKVASVLDLENTAIAELYSARCGKPVAELRTLMAAETWMNADEAVALGLSDSIDETLRVQPGQTKAPAAKKRAEAKRPAVLTALRTTFERIAAAAVPPPAPAADPAADPAEPTSDCCEACCACSEAALALVDQVDDICEALPTQAGADQCTALAASCRKMGAACTAHGCSDAASCAAVCEACATACDAGAVMCGAGAAPTEEPAAVAARAKVQQHNKSTQFLQAT